MTTCPKCGYDTGEETCPSCGVIFAKIHKTAYHPAGHEEHAEDDRPVPPVRPVRHVTIAWDVLTIKLLWLGNFVYFNAHSIGVTGEGRFFGAIFNIAMAFPSSLVMLPLAGFLPDRPLFFCAAVLVLGYLQWFFIVPLLARGGRRWIDKTSERSPKAGKTLETVVDRLRILLRIVATGYFLVLALSTNAALPISVLYFSGAVAVFLAFRPRRRRHTLLAIL